MVLVPILGGNMCTTEEDIKQLKCQIAKLQRRICELECSRGFVINPQPYYTPVYYSINATDTASTGNSNQTTGDEYKC